MPTFQGVSLHPTVQSRLRHPHPQRTDNHGGDDGRQSDQGAATPLHISGVSTPRALLNRSPQELVSIFSRGQIRDEQEQADLLTQMEGIRDQVALSMIAKTQSGRYVLQQQKECLQAQEDSSGNMSPYNSQPLIRGGTLSGLHLLSRQREQTISSSTQSRHRFSTGCHALDELIAFPAEYTYEGGDDAAGGGLPRGYVVLISGLAGKTQLALQLAAQVTIQSPDDSVRYCYSTAGHSGYSLAQRYMQFVERTAIDVGKEELGRKIQFQPISVILDLVKSLSALEAEFLRYQECSTAPQGKELVQRPPVMLILDSFSMMVAGEEDMTQIQLIERWLKRLARQHSLIVVYTGGGGSRMEISDIHLEIQQVTSISCSIHLLRHPARLITQRDMIPLLQLTKYGITTPG